MCSVFLFLHKIPTKYVLLETSHAYETVVLVLQMWRWRLQNSSALWVDVQICSLHQRANLLK